LSRREAFGIKLIFEAPYFTGVFNKFNHTGSFAVIHFFDGMQRIGADG
jgi:hypothetical protein